MTDQQQEMPAEYAGRVSEGKSWTEIVSLVGDLPPLPHVASQALVMVEDPDATAGQLTTLLGKDTALAARVLKIANSAMFSRQREITTLTQAIMTIGFKSLKGIIVAATLRQLNRSNGKIENMIWANSTCTAIGALELTQRLKKAYVEEAFLLGLLHDLGKLVLTRQIAKPYLEAVQTTKTGLLYIDAEQHKLGFAHPLIGALVAKKWNFSPEICQIILHHHDPLEAIASEVDEKIAIVQAADNIAHALGYGHLDGYPDCAPAAELDLLKLGFAVEEHTTIIEEIKNNFAQQGGVFE